MSTFSNNQEERGGKNNQININIQPEDILLADITKTLTNAKGLLN